MFTPRLVQKNPLTFTLVAGTYYSEPIYTGDYRDIILTIVGTGTVTVLGSADVQVPIAAPDFTSSSTITNSYAPMVIADLTIPSTYATSIAVSSSTKLAEVNTNLLTWICITSTTGTVSGFTSSCDNS